MDRLAASAFLREVAPGLRGWPLVTGCVPHGLGAEGDRPRQEAGRSASWDKQKGKRAGLSVSLLTMGERGSGVPTLTPLCPECSRDVREAAGSASLCALRPSPSMSVLILEVPNVHPKMSWWPRVLGLRRQKTRQEAVSAKAARSRWVDGQRGVRHPAGPLTAFNPEREDWAALAGLAPRRRQE